MVLAKGRWLSRLEWLLVFSLSLVPLLQLAYKVYLNDLGPDPVAALIDQLGRWGMYFLWITLAISPLRWLLKLNQLIRYRRMMGLYALFYTVLHFLAFMTFIVSWDWLQVKEELVERPYITVGFVAFCLLIPLGVTSMKYWMRKLGRRWVTLHKLVYPIAILVLLHFWWQLRADVGEGVLFAVLLASLLLLRVIKKQSDWLKRKKNLRRKSVA